MFTYTSDEQAANRATLIAALRSGEYKQGEGYLRRREDYKHAYATVYCCLGVACKISGLGSFDYTDAFITAEEGEVSSTHLPGAVRKWLGFATDNGALINGDMRTETALVVSSLMDANDLGVSFAQIADIIEENRVETVY